MLIEGYDVWRHSGAALLAHRRVLQLPENAGTLLGVLFFGDRPVSL